MRTAGETRVSVGEMGCWLIRVLTHGSGAAKSQDEDLHGDDALALGPVDVGSVADEDGRAAHVKSRHFECRR